MAIPGMVGELAKHRAGLLPAVAYLADDRAARRGLAGSLHSARTGYKYFLRRSFFRVATNVISTISASAYPFHFEAIARIIGDRYRNLYTRSKGVTAKRPAALNPQLGGHCAGDVPHTGASFPAKDSRRDKADQSDNSYGHQNDNRSLGAVSFAARGRLPLLPR